MGTRALTIVKDADYEYLFLMRQADGYIDCHGKLLAKFLKGKKLTDGFSSRDRKGLFNGLECLAAQIVAHFKEAPGRFYLGSKEVMEAWGEPSYTYIVSLDGGGELRVKVESLGEAVFEGSPAELENFQEDEE